MSFQPKNQIAVAVIVSLGLCCALIADADANQNEPTADKAQAKRPSPAARASCSSLCQVRHPLETAAEVVAEMGYAYVDLSCLNWKPHPPHADVAALLEDFDKEASRIEKALAANKLRVSNLTFDGVDFSDFDGYVKRFEVVIKLANRLDARLVNIMAPPKEKAAQGKPAQPQALRQAADKLKIVQTIAARHGVTLTLETHTYQLTEFPDDAAWLCKQVPGLGLTLDPSHYHAGPNQGKAYDVVYPYVRGTGFRAGGMEWKTIQMPWGEGPIDFAAIVRELESRGYKGFYVAEYIEGFNELDAVVESKKFLAWIQSLKPLP